MKKRLLFVDDEPMILQGLQRMLRSLRSEWDMAFADSGAKALEMMAEMPFDVVVSDMRMPGMNGVELLSEVMKRYPKTVRLILSGHADRDLILKCVGSTHQYLSKPCDPEALKHTLHRTTALESSLNGERLIQLVSRIDQLPSIPAVYTAIVEKLRDPEVSVDEVSNVILKDIGMTAKILKLVNSAFFGMRRHITGLEEAVAYLGIDTVKSLVLSVHAFSQFEDKALGGLSLETLWGHSQDTAAWAKLIVAAENGPRWLQDAAFTAGLLHDIGKLVLAANFSDQYKQVLELLHIPGLTTLAAETQVFGAAHAGVGGYLLGLWGLPVPVVEAIALHHTPGEGPDRSFGPLTAVHVANVLVHQNQGDEAAELDDAYLKDLGLSERIETWRGSEDFGPRPGRIRGMPPIWINT